MNNLFAVNNFLSISLKQKKNCKTEKLAKQRY